MFKNIPKVFQNASFGLSLFVSVLSKKARNRMGYSSSFSTAPTQKSSRPKPRILKDFGYALVVLLFSSCLFAAQDPLYVGVNGGFGSTTWKGLVPSLERQNEALNISTPIQVQEGGFVYGAYVGYEFTPFFAIEGNYKKYPHAKIIFDQYSLFSVNHEERNSFHSDSDAVSLMAKVMLVVPKSMLRVYSSVGAARVHRKDEIINQQHVSPTFGAGVTIDVTPHIMVDIGFNYTAGFGEPELSPSDHYIPFLYSGNIGLACRV